WWWFDFGIRYPPSGESIVQTFSGRTDATGTHRLRLDFEPQGDASQNPRPLNITAEGTVMDVNRQAWTSATSLLVHPADVYIGLRSARYFVERGAPLKIDFIVTDLDGNPQPGRPVEVRAARLEWKYQQGEWNEVEVDVQTCTMTSAAEPQTCTFETPIGGSYRIIALVTDAQGRRNQTIITRWVSGGQRPPSRRVEQEEVTLIPDKETYQPGDVAEILVQSPFSPAEGLLTVSRSGFLYTESFQIENGTATLRVPVENEHIPNLNIQVDVVGSAPRTDDSGNLVPGAPPRPAYAHGELNLSIPPLARTLVLTVRPDQTALAPGSQTFVDVTVTDANGRPVPGAELAVVVVDESILALTNYQLTDPLSVFYSTRPALVTSVYARASIILLDPAVLAQQMAMSGAADRMLALGAAAPMPTAMPAMAAPEMEASKAAAPGAAENIRVRADFNPLAVFAPSVVTDARGAARVQVRLPDNLTRYRVMVVAVDSGGARFGSGESAITARLPLMVRPAAPRFLNFGDRFELPVVLQNQTDAPMEVSLVAQAANLEVDHTAVRVTVPANDRIEVRLPASTVRPGVARVQFAAVSGDFRDAASVALPVYTPATTEAFAAYGVLDSGAVAQPFLPPSDVIPQYGGLEITTSSTALQALTDAVIYLVEYPFECSEQLASRILGIAALRDVLTAFEAQGLPAPAELEAAVVRDMERLAGMQNYDGGFPYWRRGFESSPFNTIHVTHALVRARQKGFDVPEAMQSNALNYLRNIENYYPDWYDQNTRYTLSAYALYVRNLSGERDAAKARLLINEAGLENLSLDAIGWLWPVVDDPSLLEAMRRYVGNRVVETAGAANFTTTYSDQAYLLLNSDRRTDAILLDALMGDNPNADLIPKLVNGLLAQRTKGRWGNTQENVFVLLALDRYFNTYEAQTPDFVARIWLGETYLAEAAYRGRSTELRETRVPMRYLVDNPAGLQNLIISKDGAGRLYYRLGLRYAPQDLNLPALERGFIVQRVYEAVDDPADVYRDAQGNWHIKAGARVRVRITFYVDNRRYHVALVAPLPAGLEIINPELAVTGGLPPQDPGQPVPLDRFWWWGPWYEHQNLRDERAEAFATLLWDGVYEYTYFARATTPGTFIVPPAKAEEMYSPEVFGRSASDRVIVED
ncbi:MAG: alpha-2-macroglobulin family protein, partial [Anaerolineales bacterium]